MKEIKNMERNENGDVDCSGIKFKIPKDQLALSIVASNSIINGSEFAEDGWVYLSGKKIKKWHTSIGGIRIWQPTLDDVAKLEQRYWNVYLAEKKYWDEVSRPAARKLCEVDGAHVKVTHKYSGNLDPWWLYEISHDKGYGRGIGFNWVNTPASPKNLEIGTAYYKTDNRHSELVGRTIKFRDILEHAISRLLSNKYKPVIMDAGRTLQLKLNGRIYWYVCKLSNYAYWEKIQWPEDDKMIVVAL